MARRFLLVGAFVVFKRGSIEQLAYATSITLLYAIVHANAAPMRKAADNLVAIACSLLLAMLFVTSIFYKVGALTTLGDFEQVMTIEQKDTTYAVPHLFLSAILIICSVGAFAVLTVVVAVRAASEARRLGKLRRLHYKRSGAEVVVDRLTPPLQYHVFLSHRWASGQDQSRIIKQRLMELLPGVACFLDVDDLQRKRGKGAELVHASKFFLLFCSRGFFESEPCIKELLCALRERKPIITVGEPIEYHGGLSVEAARVQLSAAYRVFSQREWWGELLPTPMACGEIERLLFDEHEPIEWARIGDHQDTAMRLIATRLLPNRPEVYVHGELARSPIRLPGWAGAHLYVSQHNDGAQRLSTELVDLSKRTLRITDDTSQLTGCGVMLLHLHAQTWTDSTVDALVSEVELAMEHGVPLLLAHEEPGIYDSTDGACDQARRPIRFAQLERLTPRTLRERGIYSEIATSLKAGPLRATSLMQLLVHALPDKLDCRRRQTPRGVRGRTDSRTNSQTGLLASSPVASGNADNQASSEPGDTPNTVPRSPAGEQQASRRRRLSSFAAAVTFRNSMRRGSVDKRPSHLKDTPADLTDFAPAVPREQKRHSLARVRRGTIDSPPSSRVRCRGVGSGQPTRSSTIPSLTASDGSRSVVPFL